MACLLTYVLRLTLNHRALYCYMVLSIWILVFLGGMYKYITTENEAANAVLTSSAIFHSGSIMSSQLKPYIRIKQVAPFCNPYFNITPINEGLENRNFSLEGVLVVLRHGDRGPLTHIRNISSINCAGSKVSLFSQYEEFIMNLTGTPALSQVTGAFHGFPPLPGIDCSLGQLTRYGALQLLQTGKILNSVYGDILGLNNNTFLKKDMIVYSTRYRRTFQSALAFLFSFLPRENFFKVTMQEVQSLAFCFDDCACPAADKYFNLFNVELNGYLKSRSFLKTLIKSAAQTVYEIPDKKISGDPHSLKDALLAYVCHDGQLPCRDKGLLSESCVKDRQVITLFSYLQWEARQYWKSRNLRYSCLLKAYGLIRNLVSHLLRLVSEKRPKVVIYSGHDKTINYMTTALGVFLESTAWPTYASRLIFEVYRSRDDSASPNGGALVGSDYYFRLVFNGRDVTSYISFCKNQNLISVPNSRPTVGKRMKKNSTADLCHIESIIRFLHEDYFGAFNTTNMKDACNL